MNRRGRVALVTLALAGCGEEEQLGQLPPEAEGSGCAPACTGPVTGGTETGGEDEGFKCGEKELTPQVGKARLLFVLDRSGSMGDAWDHDEDPDTPDTTRWAILHGVVSQVAEGFDDQIELGAMVFPSQNGDCVVDSEPHVPVAADNGQAIVDFLPPANVPPTMGQTPTVSALGVGFDYLVDLPDAGFRAIVLMTDGEPTCGLDLFAAADIVGQAFEEDGIFTYAVGLAVPPIAVAGFEMVAQAGGAPHDGDQAFYDIGSQVDLEEAIAEITDQARVCTILLSPEPELPDGLKLKIDGDEIPRVDDCDAENGWVYKDPGEYGVVEMCGSYCEQIKAGDVELLADYECPSTMPGP